MGTHGSDPHPARQCGQGRAVRRTSRSVEPSHTEECPNDSEETPQMMDTRRESRSRHLPRDISIFPHIPARACKNGIAVANVFRTVIPLMAIYNNSSAAATAGNNAT